MMKKRAVFFCSLLVLMFTADVYAAGLNHLMKLGRSQSDAQQTYRQETKAYGRVCSAIMSKDIKAGMTKKDVMDRYGDPVVCIKEYGTCRDKFIYKPANANFFEGPKAEIIFDESGKVIDAKLKE